MTRDFKINIHKNDIENNLYNFIVRIRLTLASRLRPLLCYTIALYFTSLLFIILSAKSLIPKELENRKFDQYFSLNFLLKFLSKYSQQDLNLKYIAIYVYRNLMNNA